MYDAMKALGIQTDFSIEELPEGETLESECKKTLSECKHCPGLSDCEFAKEYAKETIIKIASKLLNSNIAYEKKIIKEFFEMPDDVDDALYTALITGKLHKANESLTGLINLFAQNDAEKCIEYTKDTLGLNDVPSPKQTIGSRIINAAKNSLAGLAAAAVIAYSTFIPQHLERAGSEGCGHLSITYCIQKDTPYPMRLILPPEETKK